MIYIMVVKIFAKNKNKGKFRQEKYETKKTKKAKKVNKRNKKK